jgi:transposase
MKNLFIGVDFSKLKFDATVIDRDKAEASAHETFDNTAEGAAKLAAWVRAQTKRPAAEWLFCGEHTGLYCVTLAEALVRGGHDLWLETPRQIKRSAGLQRGKSDKADSLALARYALRFADRARRLQLPEQALQDLQMLMAYRARLEHSRHALLVAATELRRVRGENATARFVHEDSLAEVDSLHAKIKAVERKMLEAIRSSEPVRQNYELATSITSIGLMNAAALLVATLNFSTFENPRQLACYVGVVPFGRQSGTSIHGAPHTSPLANHQIRAFITNAARNAVQRNPTIRAYYQRKLAEGKNEFLVLNNVKNKLIHYLAAVVKKRQPYIKNYSQYTDYSMAA